MTKYLSGDKRHAKLVEIAELWSKNRSVMREWGNDLNKILDHLSDRTQQKTLECMREEWGKEEVCDEFAVVCKITIMKKIVFHSDFLTKAILGSTYPGVYSRAMDMWIRALENETIPSVWLLGDHWLCDKEDRAHILTMNERMDRLVATWGQSLTNSAR